MSQMLSKRRNAGYNMMEVMMVTALVAILATIAIPSFKYVTTSNRIAGEVNGLLGDMQFARSEAVKEGQSVTVCIAQNVNLNSCAGNAANGNWALGWIVFLDTNGNKQVDANEAVIRTQPAFSGTDTFVAPGAFNALTFNRLGYAPTAATVIKLHDLTSNVNWIRCLAVNPIGSVVTERNGFGTPACN
jgi:type IV fimbrial biogenesis protein FimT